MLIQCVIEGDGRWVPYEEHIADRLEEEYTTAAKVRKRGGGNTPFHRLVFFIDWRRSTYTTAAKVRGGGATRPFHRLIFFID